MTNDINAEVAVERHLLIFGLGFAASAIGLKLQQDFNTITVTNRSLGGQSADSPYRHLVFDGKTISDELAGAIKSATHILISIGPDKDGDPVINAAGEHLKTAANVQWLGYLSTVGVYGNHDGEWVNEETRFRPVSARSIERLKAEQNWQEMAADKNIPLGIFRLSGIYGPGRNAMVNMEKGRSRRLVKKDQVFNRIHRDDIATAVQRAIGLNAGGIFNITDDEPAPPQDVVTFVHELRGSQPPPEIDFETADLTPMARSFYGENKRVSNAKSKSVLGMEYAWPNYRVTFEAMWKNDNWR